MVLNLADDLTAKGFKGLLISALTDFRRFYRTYSGMGHTLSGQLGGAHLPDISIAFNADLDYSSRLRCNALLGLPLGV